MARITRHDSHNSLTRYSDSPRKGKKLHNNLQNYNNQNMNKTSMKRTCTTTTLFIQDSKYKYTTSFPGSSPRDG